MVGGGDSSITGHSEPCQDTLGRSGKPVFWNRQKPHFLQKCKQGTSSSVERLSSGAVSLSSPHSSRGIAAFVVSQ